MIPYRLPVFTAAYLVCFVVGNADLHVAADDVASSNAIEQNPQANQAASCPATLLNDVSQFYHRYHASNACGEENPHVTAALEHERYERFQYLNDPDHGFHQKVPDTKTIVCPAQPESLHAPNSVAGLKTAWMVENTASTSVVLTWVDTTTGQEYSAAHGKTPPQSDQASILQPGEHTVVYGYEGHVFHVRELKADGSLGIVLVQHRLGLVPVGAKKEDTLLKLATTNSTKRRMQAIFNKQRAAKLAKEDSWWSKPYALAYQAKNVVTTAGWYAAATMAIVPAILRDAVFGSSTLPSTMKQVVLEKTTLDAMDAIIDDDNEPLSDAFQRTVADETTRPAHIKECHHVNLGFRNRADVPLHVNWVNPESCQETFKFHLGTASTGLDDYAMDWKSATKFESTFIGHTYVVRLASSSSSADPMPIVETIQLQPTRIVDCPNSKVANHVQLGSVDMDVTATATVSSPGQLSSQNTPISLNETLGSFLEQQQQHQETRNGHSHQKSKNDNRDEQEEASGSDNLDLLDPTNYQSFLQKLEGNPERIQQFLEYMESKAKEYEQQDEHGMAEKEDETQAAGTEEPAPSSLVEPSDTNPQSHDRSRGGISS